VLAIRHCLVGPAEVELEEVRAVHSHPVALDQCRRLLALMPWATAIAAATTADAAAHVAERGERTEVDRSERAASSMSSR
jgi:prephenate dehydratase